MKIRNFVFLLVFSLLVANNFFAMKEENNQENYDNKKKCLVRKQLEDNFLTYKKRDDVTEDDIKKAEEIKKILKERHEEICDEEKILNSEKVEHVVNMLSLLIERKEEIKEYLNSDEINSYEKKMKNVCEAVKKDLSLTVFLQSDHIEKIEKNEKFFQSLINGSSFEKIKILLDDGANPNFKNEWGHRPLHVACGQVTPSINLIKMLIDKGADPNGKGVFGRTPLYIVSNREYQSIEALKLLLDKGADPNITENNGKTPLHGACDCNASIDFIKILLQSFLPKKIIFNTMVIESLKGYINKKDKNKRTALMYAKEKKNEETVNFLNKLTDLLEDGDVKKIVEFLNSK